MYRRADTHDTLTRSLSCALKTSQISQLEAIRDNDALSTRARTKASIRSARELRFPATGEKVQSTYMCLSVLTCANVHRTVMNIDCKHFRSIFCHI